MILNGKAEKDFLNYCYINKDKLFNRLMPCFEDLIDELDCLSEICKNALIIEWLDSIGLFINIIGYTKTKWRVILISNYDEDFNSRQEATEEAIKKANEIYNKN